MPAFTIKANPPKILRVIRSPLQIIVPNTQNHADISAIWDTGATGSAITTSVVNQLGLKPTGFRNVSTANGIAQQKTYTISMRLPNGVTISGVTATEVDALSESDNALIGMDIITLGDFSITNHNGCTHMSFRIPSGHVIDYVSSPEFGVVKVEEAKKESVQFPKRTNRNDPCPCESGKKYKHCCGK